MRSPYPIEACPWAAALALTAALGAAPAEAIELRAEQYVHVAAGEIVDGDLYATGEVITIDGIVRGDVVASGREITLNGTAEGDFMAAGQAVVVNGAVGDDVRIAGMALKLAGTAEVAGDMLAAGFSLETETGSTVHGTLIVAGYQALLAGAVGQDLDAATDALELAGSVAGNVEAEVAAQGTAPPFMSFIPSPVSMPTVQPGLAVAETAVIGGELEYTSPTEGSIDQASSIAGTVTRLAPEEKDRREAAGRRFVQVRHLIVLFLVGLTLFWLAPGWLSGLAQRLGEEPLAALGWGFVALVGIPIALFLLLGLGIVTAVITGLLTLGELAALVLGLTGVVTAVAVVAFWIVLAYIAPVAVGLLVGKRLLERTTGSGGRVLALFVGLLILTLIGVVPYLGGLVGFLVVVAGLGVVSIWLFRRLREPAPQAV